MLYFPPTGQTCVDIKDNVVNEGYYFTPKGDDPCLSCTCHDGEPEMCVAALCERPQGCQHFRKDPKECCKFTCLDPGTATPHGLQPYLFPSANKSEFKNIQPPVCGSWCKETSSVHSWRFTGSDFHVGAHSPTRWSSSQSTV